MSGTYLKDETERQNEALTPHADSRDGMTRGLAHQLNNVLTPIILSVGMLKLATSREDSDECLNLIETSARKCCELLRELLVPEIDNITDTKPETPANRAVVALAPSNNGSGTAVKTVLVIDDDVKILKTIQGALHSRNYETILAENAEEGLEFVRRRAPDLIISDVHMDMGDGYSVLESLRKNPSTKTIPFILMTGQAGFSGMRRGMDLGADDYLKKPFTLENLFAAVEARLQRQAALQEQADTRLDELRVKLSLMLPHELNTPLTGILTIGEVLQQHSDALGAREVAQMGEQLVEAGKRLQRLIQNFLLYSETELLLRSPGNKRPGRTEQAYSVINAIGNTARMVAQRHNRLGDLELQLPEAGEAAIVPDLVAKVVDELLDNAFKFSSPNTPVRVNSEESGDYLSISIRDRGLGMNAQEIAALAPYVQLKRELLEQQGTGLGLAIAKRIIELHGGSLSIESEPGKGSCFLVRLPCRPR
jgi:two-component system, sensor histidine kinase and response regulator